MNHNRYTLAMNANLTFSEWLGDELDRRGMKQVELAEQLDMAESTVSGWMHGTPPRRRACRRIARALGLEEDEVLYHAGYATRDPDYRPSSERTRKFLADPRGTYDDELRQLQQREREIHDQLADLGQELYKIRVRKFEIERGEGR